ncbi:MAG: hybrid sensor histidine kinase/response regulator [Acidobacteria bacterium]|nr:MAG: hybrid sensor histidine kinase/response regulator [Acidobacteriota bacterium]
MNHTVLIVDDSLTVRMDLADAFKAAGFRPLPCATAAEARDMLSRGSVDVIILDVLLPDANGVDLLNEIRSAPGGSAVSVVMLSSEADIKDRIRGLRTGADEYVGKPYDARYLVAKVEELIQARRSADATTILVIDDSLTFREVLRDAFQSAGYVVLEAATGEEGLRLAGTRRPTAIVVDGVLPGIDGATVIRHLRLDAALRDVPCLLLTASEGKHAELRALEAGADAFVRKEEDLDVILARLAAMLRRSPTRPQGVDETKSLRGLKKILAVDDSLTYLHGLNDALQDEGYDVILARSGEEALELLAVQTVDCILLDLLMPGLSGQETCERIKTAPTVRDIPLIMLTALEDREAMIQGLSAGADDYISKSSELQVLKARVRAQIRRKQFEDENRRIREELLRKELEAGEARAARELADTKMVLIDELERKNKELEAFSYSVSHDLRAPLRAIDGFSRIVLQDFAGTLDPKGQEYLQRVCAAAKRMGELIDDLLELSRVGRTELRRTRVNLSDVARHVIDDFQKQADRQVDVAIQEELMADADSRLMQIALENLLGNSWKFTRNTVGARIEFGRDQNGHGPIYFVRDNGAGFDMTYAEKLFGPFQRLHSDVEFPGTGIGLATVYRIVERHGGRVWAEGAVGRGATFYFTIPSVRRGSRSSTVPNLSSM